MEEKKYARQFSKAFVITLIIIMIFIFSLIVFILYLRMQEDYDELLQNYNSTSINLNQLKESYSKLKVKNDEYYKQIEESSPKLRFMDECVVIIPSNTRIYHKYDCQYLDLSNFLIFNIENARGQGYVACSHCIK